MLSSKNNIVLALALAVKRLGTEQMADPRCVNRRIQRLQDIGCQDRQRENNQRTRNWPLDKICGRWSPNGNMRLASG